MLGKMSGATVEVKIAAAGEKPPADAPALVLGSLALELGLAAPPKTVSLDGYSLKTKGNHLLMAGESPASTRFAVTHFFERFGYRWLTFGKWGEEMPALATISLDGFDVNEKPDFLFRCVWGADPARTRTGGMDLPNRHDWEHCRPTSTSRTTPSTCAARRSAPARRVGVHQQPSGGAHLCRRLYRQGKDRYEGRHHLAA